MVRSLGAVSAVALCALWMGAPTSADAQETVVVEEVETTCNPVLDSSGEPVQQESGVVVHSGSFPCPEPVAVVAAPPVVAPAAPFDAQTTVFFAFDVAELDPEAEQTLGGLIDEVQDRELSGVVVQGFADTAGPADYNMQLSERRANNVAADLTREGIPSEVIITEAFGETNLAVETPDNTPLAANRRVVVDVEG